jgi:hypothetical protein
VLALLSIAYSWGYRADWIIPRFTLNSATPHFLLLYLAQEGAAHCTNFLAVYIPCIWHTSLQLFHIPGRCICPPLHLFTGLLYRSALIIPAVCSQTPRVPCQKEPVLRGKHQESGIGGGTFVFGDSDIVQTTGLLQSLLEEMAAKANQVLHSITVLRGPHVSYANCALHRRDSTNDQACNHDDY